MELTAALLDLCSSSPRPIIAIDGPAGAGKTTLAEHLSAALSLKYKCATIRMDDLYNGWSHPFDFHLADALETACASHRKSQKYSLSFFNWSSNEYGVPIEMAQSELLILEGVGSLQAPIRSYLSASIWIEIDAQAGVKRVLSRDGDGIALQMKDWLEQQDEHFRRNQSMSAADFVLTAG